MRGVAKVLKSAAIIAGVAAAVWVLLEMKKAFGISDLAGAVIALFGFIVWVGFRLSKIEERTLHSDYSGIITALEEGERHVPQHQQPGSIYDSGFKSLIGAVDEILFEDFRWFGAVLNRNLSEPWAVEELRDTHIRDWRAEEPSFGRRYQVYYRGLKMGTVQVTTAPGVDCIFHPERFTENRQAEALIDLDYLRFVPYEDAHRFVAAVVRLIGPSEEYDREYARASAEATAALAAHLWETVRNPDIAMSFEHRTKGPYEPLRETTDHWKANGIDPFEKWGGSWLELKDV